MTHRDGFPRLSARSAWRGGAGHREPRATRPESLEKPPFRSRGRTAGVRREALPMSHIACGSPPARRVAQAISMGHYQRSLVLTGVVAALTAAAVAAGPVAATAVTATVTATATATVID